MKKILTVFLAILFALSSLCLCVYAADSGMTFDENSICKINESFAKAPKTLEAWINLPQSYTERGGVIFGNYGSAKCCLNFEINKNGVPRLYYVDIDGTVHDFKFSKVDVRTGNWAHIAFVQDSDNGKAYFYLNGALAETINNVTEYDTDVNKFPFVIGGDCRGGNVQYFKGAIRSVTAYADVRDEKEIRDDMKLPDFADADLVAYYDLRDVSSGIVDQSDNSYSASYLKTWFTDKEPVTDYAFSFAVVGDTQIVALKYPDQFHKIYDWIIANKDEKKIAHVMGLGDITDKNTAEEWAVAKESIDKMNGVVDYTLVIGNHDKSAEYNATFGTNEYKKNFEGFYQDGKIENSYRRFSVADTDYLLITLEFGANDDILNWAGSII